MITRSKKLESEMTCARNTGAYGHNHKYKKKQKKTKKTINKTINKNT
jgi:hypothetical protein